MSTPPSTEPFPLPGDARRHPVARWVFWPAAVLIIGFSGFAIVFPDAAEAFFGGLNALQTVAILIALPFSIVMLLMCWSTVLAFQRERRAYARAERAQFIQHIGEHYGLEVEEPNEQGLRPPWLKRRR